MWSSGKSCAATDSMSRAATRPAMASKMVTDTVASALASAAVGGVLRLPTTSRPAVANARKASQIQLGLMRMLPAAAASTAVATTARAAMDLVMKNNGAAASQYSGSTMNTLSP